MNVERFRRDMRWFLASLGVVVVLAIGLLLFGGGGSDSGPSPISKQLGTVAPLRPEVCRLYDEGTSLMVWIHAHQGFCGGWARGGSGSGAYWSRQASPDAQYDTLVCTLTHNGDRISVFDSGGQIQGRTVCGNLVHDGWADLG